MSATGVFRLIVGAAAGCLVAMGILYAGGAANAQGAVCLKRADLVKALAERYREVPVAAGLNSSGNTVMEVYSSPTKGTWTLFVTGTDGISCIVMAGNNWTFDTTAFDAAKKGEAF